jgi:hypothetical protein
LASVFAIAGIGAVTAAAAGSPEAEPAAGATVSGRGSDSRLVVGIDGHYSDWPSDEQRLRAALGAPVTRHEFDPTTPVAGADGFVLKAARHVRTLIHALIGGNELGDPGTYRDYVVAFVRRYGVGGTFWRAHPELDASRYAIRTIELGNEPYLGAMSAREYAESVRPTLEAVKRLRLPVKVALPSRVHGSDTRWIDTLYARIPRLNRLFHAFAEHPYWYGHPAADSASARSLRRFKVLRKRMNARGAARKPILITEYGQSTARCGSECVSERRQARELAHLIDTAAKRSDLRIGLIIVYQLEDRGTNSSDRELQFGIVREDGSRKPAWRVVRARMRRYR